MPASFVFNGRTNAPLRLRGRILNTIELKLSR